MLSLDEIVIVGVGTTKFGENLDQSYFDLIIEAVYEAYVDAGIQSEAVEAAWLGTLDPSVIGLEGDAGSALAEVLGLFPKPVTRVAAFCATGMDAVRNAIFALQAGAYNTVLVVGAEKMRDVSSRGSLVARHIRSTHPLLAKGRTAPGIFGLLAHRYFHTYGIGKETLARVAVKNHRHGALNPKAHFRADVTVRQVMDAPMVAKPLGLLDCCPTTDGAAALVITTRRLAEARGQDYVRFKGMGLATAAGYFSVHFQADNDCTGFRATREAAQMAYAQAGIRQPDGEIHVAEVHDCFTITEILDYEDLGFCEKGRGWRFLEEGHTSLGGRLPVNPSGGLLSCGHPVGATGVRMIAEVTTQLRGRAGASQVAGARRGLAHTLGGPGSLAAVTILERP